MRKSRRFRAVVGTVCFLTMLVGQSGISRAENTTPVRPIDVSLQRDGTLRGQLVDQQGHAKSQATVAVRSQQGGVTQVVSDDAGRFVVPVQRGGVYAVAHGESWILVRAWTHDTAPPAAGPAILLVDRGPTALGQGCCNAGLWVFGGLTAAAATIGVIEATNGS